MNAFKYDSLELSRIIGEPVDPRRRYPDVISKICEIDTADPDEYVYQFDVLFDTDTVYTITSNGVITASHVTPDTPALMTFIDIASPEYFMKITELAKAKERTIARKVKTINRAMNAWEIYKILDLVNTAVVTRGNVSSLGSGETTFTYKHLIDMIDQIIDYSANYELVMGTAIDKDIKLWDWTDNKYHSLSAAFGTLGIGVSRVNATVTIDGASTAALVSTRAFLVGIDTEEPSKPILFVRKKLDEIERLNGVVFDNGEKPERLVFVSPNPVQVTNSRYLAVGVTGFEEIAAAVTNPQWGLLLVIVIEKLGHIGEHPRHRAIPREGSVHDFLYGEPVETVYSNSSGDKK